MIDFSIHEVLVFLDGRTVDDSSVLRDEMIKLVGILPCVMSPPGLFYPKGNFNCLDDDASFENDFIE
jgi:hypothetical protein